MTTGELPEDLVERALGRVTARLPSHEDRPEQLAMASAVARAIALRRHLVVQAGTGTGKSLAYLVPALAMGARVVVATATKALQDQLARRDLPHLAKFAGTRASFAVLKGRSNYICAQRVAEISRGGQQLELGELGYLSSTSPAGPPEDLRPGQLGAVAREVHRLVDWAAKAAEGDRAELPWEPSALAWAQVSVSSRECPGASECPAAKACFTEAARRRAEEADVVVVNTHLYAAYLALGEGAELLPPHDVVVFDEAHELEDIVSAAFGIELGAGRLGGLARASRQLISAETADALGEAAGRLGAALVLHRDKALPRRLGEAGSEVLADALLAARERTNGVLDQLRSALRELSPGNGDAQARLLRAQRSATQLAGDLGIVLDLPEDQVAWVEGPERAPVVRTAPVDVGQLLRERLWQPEGSAEGPTAVLTSATVPPRLGQRLGLAPGTFDERDVGSPFAYKQQALLYCPLHLPDPRSPGFEKAMHDELVALIEAAGGRTLALFTSWRATEAAAAAVRQRVKWPVLSQSDLPKPKLVAKFSAEEHSCLFATMGFWQGLDVPGASLSLVTIDRIPFPRPDDPLLQARRTRLGARAFELIDLPRAATLLAQGAGRLVRCKSDRGVVAVLDRRLGKARYRWQLVGALPPMRRTRDRAEVEAFLRSVTTKA
ncbi:MAG: ATP-dependent DNA helicase [Acidimicrobiales bacterium]